MSDLGAQIAALYSMTTDELAKQYAQLHGTPCRTRHKAYLIRKIAWRLQANAEGDLSERALRRAARLANDAEVRVMAPKTMICPPQRGDSVTITVPVAAAASQSCDPRLPPPGSAIIRKYKGRTIRAIVLEDDQGFECEGERFKTLSALAHKITGSHMNGYRFFRLGVQR